MQLLGGVCVEMDIRHRKSALAVPKVDLIFDVSQVTKNGQIGPPTMRLLSRSASVPSKLKRTKSYRTVMKRNISVLNIAEKTEVASSLPPRGASSISKHSTTTNVYNANIDINLINSNSDNDNHHLNRYDKAASKNMDLFKQKSGRLNYLTNKNQTCKSPMPLTKDRARRRYGAVDGNDGFGQFFVISESEVEGIIEQRIDDQEDLSYSRMISPSFDESIASSDHSDISDINNSHDCDDNATSIMRNSDSRRFYFTESIGCESMDSSDCTCSGQEDGRTVVGMNNDDDENFCNIMNSNFF